MLPRVSRKQRITPVKKRVTALGKKKGTSPVKKPQTSKVKGPSKGRAAAKARKLIVAKGKKQTALPTAGKARPFGPLTRTQALEQKIATERSLINGYKMGLAVAKHKIRRSIYTSTPRLAQSVSRGTLQLGTQ